MKYRSFYSDIRNSILLVLVLGTCTVGCKKFVQISPPTTQLATSSVFSNNITVTAAQLAIYTKMASESYNMASSCGMLSDELTSYSTSIIQVQYYTNSMQALNGPGPWINAYNYIYQANGIIEGLRNNGNVSAAVAQQLIGESKFVRAFWYFYLVNLYGDVPLILTTDYAVNQTTSRTATAQVYQQIVADLNDAQGELNANFVDINDTLVTTERVRPSKGAAAALLARVYLYMQKYDLAEAQATQVIANTALFKLCTNLDSISGTNYVFQKNSTEAIWQLATVIPANYYTADGEFFILNTAPATGGNNNATISPQLMISFEANDKRFLKWVGKYSTPKPPVVNYYFPYKYHSRDVAVPATSPTAASEYVMVLRLAEQYLIRAEARAQQGKITDAVSDLNVIRSRAGLSNYSGAMDQASVLAAILHERQVELFSEWGHRWFDLKRTGQLDAVMGGSGGVCQTKHGSWVSTDQLFPIPQNERLNDANLTQNAGY
jgi:hypothetical protein